MNVHREQEYSNVFELLRYYYYGEEQGKRERVRDSACSLSLSRVSHPPPPLPLPWVHQFSRFISAQASLSLALGTFLCLCLCDLGTLMTAFWTLGFLVFVWRQQRQRRRGGGGPHLQRVSVCECVLYDCREFKNPECAGWLAEWLACVCSSNLFFSATLCVQVQVFRVSVCVSVCFQISKVLWTNHGNDHSSFSVLNSKRAKLFDVQGNCVQSRTFEDFNSRKKLNKKRKKIV